MIHGQGVRMPNRLAGQIIVSSLFSMDIVRAELNLPNQEKVILQQSQRNTVMLQISDLCLKMKGRESSLGKHIQRSPVSLVMVWQCVAMAKIESKMPLGPLANTLVCTDNTSMYIRTGDIQTTSEQKKKSTHISVRDSSARRNDSK